jgi:Asp-tRNA(Asn)/Glu-tRNA(Gln) amidotransferase A subunit family amidase
LGKKSMTIQIPVVPETYDPATVELCSFHNALPGFLDGRDTPRAYFERCLEVIAVREPSIKAFVMMDVEAARAAANRSTERYQSGKPLSRIDGMPFAVKDLFKTADFPTELNSPLLKGERHRFDSAHVYAMRKGGAVILGKTTLPELGSGQPAVTRNPFNLERSPGGSSSGSAASVGAAMLPVAIGSQGRGSVLRPASFCGNVALKPTFGAVHSGGMLWRSPSYSTIGIHSSNVTDCWRTAWQIAQTVGGDPGHPGLFGDADVASTKPMRLIRLDTLGWAITEPGIQKRFEEFLTLLRNDGVEIISRHDNPAVEAFEQALATIPEFQPDLAAWEMQWPALLVRDRGRDQIKERLVERFEFGERMSLDEYRVTLEALSKLRDVFASLEGVADGFITLPTPTMPPVGDATGDSVFGDPSSCLEAPAWCFPLLRESGLPLGIQLLGNKHQDYRLGQIGQWMMETFLR